jgi:hypothetical protein
MQTAQHIPEQKKITPNMMVNMHKINSGPLRITNDCTVSLEFDDCEYESSMKIPHSKMRLMDPIRVILIALGNRTVAIPLGTPEGNQPFWFRQSTRAPSP